MELDADEPIALGFHRIQKTNKPKGKPLSDKSKADTPRDNCSPEILVSEFNHSIDDHFKFVEEIARSCGIDAQTTPDGDEAKQISSSVTFLREWRDFNYAPRVVKFACQSDAEERDVIGSVTLPQFSSAAVPKKLTRDGSSEQSMKDFIMHVGGAVWAMDWCPRFDHDSENPIKVEFVAIAAHPPESSYHKIGAPLTGRGAVQIWCLVSESGKETVNSNGPNGLPRPRGRPRKVPLDSVDNETKVPRPIGRPRKVPLDSVDDEPKVPRPIGRPRKVPLDSVDNEIKVPRPRGRPRKAPLDSVDDEPKVPRPKGRPRKRPLDSVDNKPKVSRPRGRPGKKPDNDSVGGIDTENQYVQPLAIEYHADFPGSDGPDVTSGNASVSGDSGCSPLHSSTTENAATSLSTARKRRDDKASTMQDIEVYNSDLHLLRQCGSNGRPRKKPNNDSVENIDIENQSVQPLAIEYPADFPGSHGPDMTSGNAGVHGVSGDTGCSLLNSSPSENAAAPLSTTRKCRKGTASTVQEIEVDNNGLHVLRQCGNNEASLIAPVKSVIGSLDSTSAVNDITCDSVGTSEFTVPRDTALPRMMLCLAHNGKVAWDVKWRPVNARRFTMGYLAVLLGNGALEVWEVPLPHTVKLVFPSRRKLIDPRFVRLQPVFRCSILKCGDKQSIPLTLEWSTVSPHDMILAGCHDGTVALWKFTITDSSKESRPLLSFSADAGPIRTLAWSPIQSDLESANVIVTAGHRGFRFWDIRDPFRPLWDHAITGVTCSLDWLSDPRCVVGSLDDGTLWLLNLERTAYDIPVTGKSISSKSKHGFHSFDCSSFSIWSIQASRLTGIVAYCGEDGTTFCYQPTTRYVRDPSRNRLHHNLCGSLVEEESAIIITSPLASSMSRERTPSKKCSGLMKDHEKALTDAVLLVKNHEQASAETRNEQPLAIVYHGSDPADELGSGQLITKKIPKSKLKSKSQHKSDQQTCGDGTKREVFPPKTVAMHRVRWNGNKGSEKWLCHGGAAGLVRCQEIDLSLFQ